MKKNNEITLRINGNIEELIECLKIKGYEEKEHFILYDTFMIPENLEIEKLSTRQIISKAIIIRKVEDIFYNSVRQDISYKIKKINDKGEILEQKSIRLKISDCKEAESFMKALGYKKIMNIVEEDYEYTKEGFRLITKDVKNGDKMIEVETQINNEKFDTIDKLKKILKEEQLDLDYTDFFVKKAEVELDKILNRKK